MLKSFIKQIIAEALSTNATHKARIKFFFEQWVNKFSASYMQYREQKYPISWTVASLSYAEEFKHQYIKPLFEKHSSIDQALIFEHDGSICVVNDKELDRLHLSLTLSVGFAFTSTVAYWHELNLLFKLSVSDFETAFGVADNYDEFIVLCSQLNEKYEQDVNEDE